MAAHPNLDRLGDRSRIVILVSAGLIHIGNLVSQEWRNGRDRPSHGFSTG
ncbi:hypothetical protein ACN4EK_17810 [Pantanalinema rosaneae CENA516]